MNALCVEGLSFITSDRRALPAHGGACESQMEVKDRRPMQLQIDTASGAQQRAAVLSIASARKWPAVSSR